MPKVSIVIPTHRRHELLEPCLQAIGAQRFEASEIEVLAVFNGVDEAPSWPAGTWPFELVVERIERAHIGAAKNVGLDRARGEWIVLLNDDVLPARDFVREHLAAHRASARPRMVLGLSAWKRYADERIFDRMIQTTSMIFFYEQMRPRNWYNYRHAWNLNLSLHRRWLEDARFDESLGPFFFEDLELAYRLEREHGLRVWYAPEAECLHDHRYTLDGYLDRERALGQAATRLWRANPDCYRDIYRADLDEAAVQYAREFIEREGRDERERIERLRTIAERRVGDFVPSIATLKEFTRMLYDAHLPLKRLAFRRGFLEGVNQTAATVAS